MVGHDPEPEQAPQPVREAEQVLGGAVGQAQVLPQQQGGEQAGRVVDRIGVPAQARRHDPARGGDRQPREAQEIVVHGAPEMGTHHDFSPPTFRQGK